MKNNEFGNKKNKFNMGKTMSFKKSQQTSDNLKVNTTVNIKKANAKKAIKKSSAIAKAAFRWILYVLMTLFIFGVISGVIIGTTFAVYVKDYLIEDYDIIGLKDNLDKTTKIFYTDANGVAHELKDERIFGTENRSWISYQKMPKNLTNAFVAIEDERFWEHKGVDWKRTLGAVVQFATGNDSYGGSTITQQLIKNFSGEDDTSIQRKVKEIFRALSITEKRSKEEILEMYLNTINLSRSNYGVQAAANYYFGKDVSDLSLVECASLASIPKSPTKYDPVRNPENNKDRRNTVLKKMRDLEWISEEEYLEAKNQELVLNITVSENGQVETEGQAYSYFKDALIEQLINDLYEQYGYSREYANNLIFSGGLEIYVTMDPYIQSCMEEVFEDESNFEKVSEGIQPECAMVVMNPYNGDILGLVGGRGEKTGRRELNRATQSKRQVGSSIKPLTVYAPAVDLGIINYSTVFDDTPYKYNESLGRFWPSNSPARYDGKISVNDAIRLSKNTVAVKVLDKMSVDYSYNFATKKLHLDSLNKADKDLAPLALGGLTEGLTLLEMTAAYSIFPNDGCYSTPRLYTKVLYSDGRILLENKIEQDPAISQSTATIMTKMLQNVVTSGTAAKLTLDQKVNIAGKTGTTNDNKDLYFVGYTPYYVGGCWFGYDTPKNLAKFKSSTHLTIWEKVMEKIHEPIFNEVKNGTAKLETFDYSKLTTREYCLDSGLLPSDACLIDVRTVMNGTSRIDTGYYYQDEGVPTQTCNTHVKVDWDSTTNRLSCGLCPNEVLVDASLIEVNDRNFVEDNVQITDANFTYRRVPHDYIYPDTAPFYKNLPDINFVGYNSNTEGPVNQICPVHNQVQKMPDDETSHEEQPDDNSFDHPLDNNQDDNYVPDFVPGLE